MPLGPVFEAAALKLTLRVRSESPRVEPKPGWPLKFRGRGMTTLLQRTWTKSRNRGFDCAGNAAVRRSLDWVPGSGSDAHDHWAPHSLQPKTASSKSVSLPGEWAGRHRLGCCITPPTLTSGHSRSRGPSSMGGLTVALSRRRENHFSASGHGAHVFVSRDLFANSTGGGDSSITYRCHSQASAQEIETPYSRREC